MRKSVLLITLLVFLSGTAAVVLVHGYQRSSTSSPPSHLTLRHPEYGEIDPSMFLASFQPSTSDRRVKDIARSLNGTAFQIPSVDTQKWVIRVPPANTVSAINNILKQLRSNQEVVEARPVLKAAALH